MRTVPTIHIGADHRTRLSRIVLGMLTCFCALVLAVTLYAITRDEDRDVALLVLVCRVGEGVLGGAFMVATLGLLWLATAGAAVADAEATLPLAEFFLRMLDWSPLIAATFFAGPFFVFMWLPIAIFEFVLGPWLIFKGVAPSSRPPGALTSSASGGRRHGC